MRKVRGFKLGAGGPKVIEVPFNASFLNITWPSGLVAWYQCDDDDTRTARYRFVVFAKDEEIKELYLQHKDTLYDGQRHKHVFFDPRPEGAW